MEINSVVPDYLKTNMIRATRSFEVALILKDTGDLLMVEAKLKKDIEKCEELFGIGDIHILSLKEVLASVYWSSNRWKMAENLLLEVIGARQDLQGKCHQDTLNSKMELAKAYIDEEVLSRPSRAEQLRGIRTELLEAIKSNSRIEERTMVQAAEYLDERMFKLLLGLERDSVPVTNDLVKVISKPIRGDGKMLILLEERGMDSEITEDMAQFIAMNCGHSAVKSLMQKRRADVEVTSELLKEVAKRREADEQIDLLLDGRGADICADNGLLATVARMHYPHTLVMMDLILKIHSANIAIKEETVITAAENVYYGGRMIRMLFTTRGANIIMTENIMITAAKNIKQGSTIIKELLAKQGANIVVTKEIMITAAGNKEQGGIIIKELLAKKGASIVITEEIMITAAGNKEQGGIIIKELLAKKEASIVITEEIMITAARNIHQGNIIMRDLFAQQGANIVITERILIAAMANENHGKTIIKWLFAQAADLAMREKIIIAVVGNENYGNPILREIFEEQGANMVITEKIVIAAIRNDKYGQGLDTIQFLLEELGADINITLEVMKAVSKKQNNMRERFSLMMYLFKMRGADMEVTEEMVRVIMNEIVGPKYLLALLIEKQGEKLRVTEGMVRMVEEKLPEEVALLETMKDNIRRYSSGSTGSAG